MFIIRDWLSFLSMWHSTMVKCRCLPCGFEPPLVQDFLEKYHIPPLLILRHCFDVVFLGEALHSQMLRLPLVKMCRPYLVGQR